MRIEERKVKSYGDNLIKKMFLDYANNFVSVYFFAECYKVDYETALKIINKGRYLNNGS
jgi:hypothetical protein